MTAPVVAVDDDALACRPGKGQERLLAEGQGSDSPLSRPDAGEGHPVVPQARVDSDGNVAGAGTGRVDQQQVGTADRQELVLKKQVVPGDRFAELADLATIGAKKPNLQAAIQVGHTVDAEEGVLPGGGELVRDNLTRPDGRWGEHTEAGFGEKSERVIADGIARRLDADGVGPGDTQTDVHQLAIPVAGGACQEMTVGAEEGQPKGPGSLIFQNQGDNLAGLPLEDELVYLARSGQSGQEKPSIPNGGRR